MSFTSQSGGFAASTSKQRMRAALERFVSVLPERTSAATGARRTHETASLVFVEPLVASTRQISPIARSRRRTDALIEAFGAARRSNPHRAQKYCGTNSLWSKVAMPARHAGHRSRSPQPCTKHDTRDASRHCRRKYGASSVARHCGQYCIQVERFRCARSRSGSRRGAIAQPLVVIAATTSCGTPVWSASNPATWRGRRRSRRGDHILSSSPRTPANDRGAMPFASARRWSQLDSSSSGSGSTETGQQPRATSPYRSRISIAKPARAVSLLTAGRRAPAPGGASRPGRSVAPRCPIS